MATKENKERKLGGFFSTFYRSSSKLISHKPKPLPSAAVLVPVVNNKPVTHVAQSLLLKKLENNCQTKEQLAEAVQRSSGIEKGGGVVEGRKSVSHVETNLSSVISFLQVKVLVSDMPGFMQVHAFRCARRTYDSLDKFSSRHMAYNMKKVC